jgi:hypothetical protein
MTSDLRRRTLEAIDGLDGGTATGSALLRRLRERQVDGESGAIDPAPRADGQAAADEPDIYPVLHRLEADWKVRAPWQIGADGAPHRAYRRRRLMPRLPRKGLLG